MALETINNMSISSEINNVDLIESTSFHKLSDKWTLWVHLPHDTDWTMKSYKTIYSFENMEEAISVCEVIPEKMIQNCMMFLMRDGIMPLWEDKKNRNGGCFSYKVANSNVAELWRKLFYNIVGETTTDNNEIIINGYTISPKKNFCIIKIWTENCKVQNPKIFNLPGFSEVACLFKTHQAQY